MHVCINKSFFGQVHRTRKRGQVLNKNHITKVFNQRILSIFTFNDETLVHNAKHRMHRSITNKILSLYHRVEKRTIVMNNYYKGRVAVVTGASSGIGAAIAKDLVRAGLKVVGLARRKNRMEELQGDLGDAKGKLYAYQCDITKEEEILRAFKWIKDNLGGVDVLVNNAGVIRNGFLTEQKTSEWREVIDTNMIALCICTREAIRSLRERGLDDGHIIHISSICGRRVPKFPIPTSNVYPATKHAVTALVEGLRQELIYQGSKIKISCVSPGIVRTEIFNAANMTTISDDVLAKMPGLDSEDISQAVMYCLSTPPHVHIQELIIKPVGEEI